MCEVFQNELNLSYGDPPYDIHLAAKKIGADILAAVTGGTRTHIGSAALAEPGGAVHPITGEPACSCGEKNKPGESDQAAYCGGVIPDDIEAGPRVSVLTAFGHKDAVIAEMFACGLCKKYGVTICVTAGVHVDGAGRDEIELMVENAKKLLAKLVD